jgi:hypothetical protein
MEQKFQRLMVKKQEEEPSISATTDENVDSITVEELTEAAKYSKNEKGPGYDGINIELIRHAPTALH